MADVTLTYKGNTILELDDSAEKSIKTAGKYLEDDIGLNYVKSGGGGYASVGDGNNFIKNSDFSINNTGSTSWSNSYTSQANAIDFWSITQASLSINQNGGVRLSRNGNANAYLMQLFMPDQLEPFVRKNVKIIAIINGVTYTSEGILSNTGNSVESSTPYGTIRVYRYTDYYAVTIDIQDSAADYIDITGVAFGLASNLVFPPSLTTKTITSNGTYDPLDDNANGYSSVTVNVPGGSGGYPPLPSDYQELEYLVTTPANGYPRIIADGFGVQAGDHAKFTFGGRGVICGQRTTGWNFNVNTVDRFNVTLYNDAKVFYSWENLEQSLGETAYVCEISFSSTYANNMTYGGWGTSTGDWDYNFEGNLGVFMVLRPTIVGDDLQTISQKYVCVRVLIPCYRKADGVNGFYDSVNNVFYTAVFGTFTRGPEKQ